MKKRFLNKSLLLQQIKKDVLTIDNTAVTLEAWLIGVGTVLGAICIVLLVALVWKTRTLTQRLNKLSNTQFGSQESVANRNPNMPNSNKHMYEGSNPIFNEEKKMPSPRER